MNNKPTCWAIGSLTIFIMLAIDASLSRLHLTSLCEYSSAPFAIITGAMLLLAAACASKTLRTWIQENSDYLLPLATVFLVVPLVLSMGFDLLFGLSATSRLFIWSVALMVALASALLVLCNDSEIKLTEVAVATLTCYGASMLLWMIFDSLFLIALALALVAAACLVSLWSKCIPLEKFLFDFDEDEFDVEFEFTANPNADTESATNLNADCAPDTNSNPTEDGARANCSKEGEAS